MTTTAQTGHAKTTVVALREHIRERQLANYEARFLDLLLERITTALAHSPAGSSAQRPSRDTVSSLTVHHLLALLD